MRINLKLSKIQSETWTETPETFASWIDPLGPSRTIPTEFPSTCTGPINNQELKDCLLTEHSKNGEKMHSKHSIPRSILEQQKKTVNVESFPLGSVGCLITISILVLLLGAPSSVPVNKAKQTKTSASAYRRRSEEEMENE